MKTVQTLFLLASLLNHPAPLAKQSRRAPAQSGAVAKARDGIPTVAFCELVRTPTAYFDNTVRVTTTYRPGVEGAALADDRCLLSNYENIGVGFIFTGKRQRDAIDRNVNRIASGRYGNGWAQVTVVGILRNVSSHAGGTMGYLYRFDIIRFEDIRKGPDRTIINYNRELKVGVTYRATVRGDKDFHLMLVPQWEVPIHYAVGVDWTNLDEFPALKRLSDASQRVIVFRVTSDDIRYLGGRRWRRIVNCKVIAVQ
jgi:hypothetical protein